MTMVNGRGAHWMWTTNDPDVKPVINDLVRYVQEQPEHSTGSGWHRQGYVEFSKRLNSGAAREALGFPTKKMGTKSGKLYRLQRREGTQAQAMMYCSSTWYCCGEKCRVGDATELRDRFLVFGGTRLREAGSCFTQDAELSGTSEWKDHSECPEFTVKGKVGSVVCVGIPVPQGRGGRPGHVGQGDVHEKILADIEAGLGRKHIFRTYAPYCQKYYAWVERQLTQFAPVRRWMPHVYWLWGAAGSDKSRMARSVLDCSCFCKAPDTTWFDGYDMQEVLIINDLRQSTFTFSYLLDMLDRYECRVEVKGGYTPLLAKVVIITCSKSHHDLWAQVGGAANENLQQLTRRIKKEFNVGKATDYQKDCCVQEMRESIVFLRDRANWDVEVRYGQWDGKSSVPRALKRSADRDETVPPVPKPKRVKASEGRASHVNPGDDDVEQTSRSFSTNQPDFVAMINWELGQVCSESAPPASDVSETSNGGIRLMQKSLPISVGLAISPVRSMMATHLGLVRAAVVASRLTDPRVLD